MRFKHDKTGNIYVKIAACMMKEIGGDWVAAVVYHPDDCENTIYVRSEQSFYDGFTPVDGES